MWPGVLVLVVEGAIFEPSFHSDQTKSERENRGHICFIWSSADIVHAKLGGNFASRER